MEEITKKNAAREVLAQGYIEVQTAHRAGEQEKLKHLLEEEAFDKVQQEGEDVELLLQRGRITAEDARRKRARQRMQEKSERQRVSTGTEITNNRAAWAASGFQTTEQILEATLRDKSHNWLVDVVWKLSRLDKLENLISWERRKRAHPSYKHRFPSAYTIARNSPSFEAFMFCVVLSNALLISFQIGDEKGESGFLLWTERVIMAVFLVEITLRVVADGWLWFLDWANTVDFVLIVATGVLPTFIFKPFMNMTDTPVLRIGQILRCLRLVRILKRLRGKFRTLWMLISGVLESGLTMIWTLVMGGLILYMFAVIIQHFLMRSDWNYEPEQQALVDKHFKDVFKAMFTLFQFLTLDSWTGVCRPLHRSYLFPVPAFLIYIAIAVMVLNNLVVAVIVNNAFARSENDEELQATIKKEEVQNEMDSLYELFDLLVDESSERLTREDYERGLQKHQELWDKLRTLQVDDEDIENLWEFLMFAEEISPDVWANNLRSLKGVVKAKDSYTVSVTLRRQSIRINKAARELEMQKKLSYDMLRDAIGIQRDMRQVMLSLQDFTKYLNACMPPDAVAIKSKAVNDFSDAMSRKIAELLEPIMVPEALDELQNSKAFLTPTDAFTEKKRSLKKQKAIRGGNRQSNDARQLSDLAPQQEPLQLEDVEDADFEPVAARADVGRRGSKSEGGEQAMLGWSVPGEVEETNGGLRQRSPKGSD